MIINNPDIVKYSPKFVKENCILFNIKSFNMKKSLISNWSSGLVI